MSTASTSSNPFGVARDFRTAHGEEAFRSLAISAFSEADVDESGSIDKPELRATLKKLGVRMTGATAAILEHYDTDSNGQISEDEFLRLVSDIIDGTFDESLKPKLQAQQTQQQLQQQAAALQQQAVVVQQQQQQQQQLISEVTRLQTELVSERAANGNLRGQVKDLKKQLMRIKRAEEDAEEKRKKDAKKAAEDAHEKAANAKMLAKLNKF